MKKITSEHVIKLVEHIPHFYTVYEAPIDQPNQEFEDDCFLHIVRKGFRVVFYNGEDEGRLKEKHLSKYVKLVEHCFEVLLEEKIKIIDCTPNWMNLYPLFEDYILYGNQENKEYVCHELKRLCELADQFNKERKNV
jgi:hypothetical protein